MSEASQKLGPVVKTSPSVGVSQITPSDSVTVSAGFQFGVVCTVAGNVSLIFADGSTLVWPVGMGATLFPWAIIGVKVTGTTAVASYYNFA